MQPKGRCTSAVRSYSSLERPLALPEHSRKEESDLRSPEGRINVEG